MSNKSCQNIWKLIYSTKYVSFLLKTLKSPGFSLGSQVFGAAGRAFKDEAHFTLGRITALDPTYICFYLYKSDYLNAGTDYSDGRLRTLSIEDAFQVDVIHTNGGQFGYEQKIGSMDFYPNRGSEQPGCDTNFVCSHLRAPKLFARTIADENAQKYMACKYEEAPCNDEKNPACMPMGYHRKFDDPHGKYYLETESESDVVGALTILFS